MDDDQGQAEEMDRQGPPLPDGVRRSRRLQNLPPPPPSAEEEGGSGSYSASERKRPRLQEVDEGTSSKKEVGDGDAEDTKVEWEGETLENPLPQPQGQLPLMDEAKVGGRSRVEDATFNEGGEAGNAGSSGTSEIRASENFTTEGKWAPNLKNSDLISEGPGGGGDQVAVGGAGTDNNVKDADSDSTGPSAVLEQPAPLQNTVVLTNLFEVCPPTDLAKFRLVCKEWRDLSLKAWRTSATLKIERHAEHRRLYTVGGTWTLLNQFMDYVEKPENECEVKPFRRIKLNGWTFNPSRTEIKRFWHLTGRYLTSLDLRDCTFSSPEEFWRITYNLRPNLIRLCLRNCSIINDPNGDRSGEPQLKYEEPLRGKHEHLKCLVISDYRLPITWLELLSHFQSLTSLQVEDFSDSKLQSLLNAIKVIREHPGNKLALSIKHFDIRPFEITHDMASHPKFFLARELNLPLKLLVVRAHPDLDVQVVSDILELHSGTLENLELKKGYERYGAPMDVARFPYRVELEKLQNLSIDSVLLESLEILKCVPNLRNLYINDELGFNGIVCMQDWHAENTARFLPKLTKFTFSSESRLSTVVDTLAKLVPNVEELVLKVRVDDEEFSEVCENWKGLMGLTITARRQEDADYLTDLGLTGGTLRIEQSGMKWVHKAVRPNITDLKELRSFSCRSNKLTEVSVYHGFLQLPNLQTLTLSASYGGVLRDTRQPFCFGQRARNKLREKVIMLNFTAGL